MTFEEWVGVTIVKTYKNELSKCHIGHQNVYMAKKKKKDKWVGDVQIG